MVHSRSARGLDWLSFFVANVQTGFGPFIAAYLAAEKWTQGQIGLALTIGTVTSMVMQVPGGAIVDAIRDKRGLALSAVGAIAASALILGAFPERFPVGMAEILHGLASCVLGPVIAALSLAVAGLQGHALGERLGRNARFASIGSGCAAGLMGAVGYWVSERSVFFLAAALVLPAVVALRWIEVVPADLKDQRPPQKLSRTLLDRRLIIFAVCCAGFQFANAAMFPIAAVQVTRNTGRLGELVIAACLIVPQVLVAALSPFAGRAAERWGRRPVLLIGFAAVPLRGLLFALTEAPALVVIIQALDGVSAAAFGVLLPLVVADISRRSGRFNLSMGAVGLAITGAAALSTEVAGVFADRAGTSGAFVMLAAAGVVTLGIVWFAMPETRGTKANV
jgi:MFS family permease